MLIPETTRALGPRSFEKSTLRPLTPKVRWSDQVQRKSVEEAAGLAEQKTIYRNLVLIDGTESNARSGMANLVRDDRIAAILPAAELTP